MKTQRKVKGNPMAVECKDRRRQPITTGKGSPAVPAVDLEEYRDGIREMDQVLDHAEGSEADACDAENDVKRPQSAEEQLQSEIGRPDRPEDLVPRAPIVTVMGHVDHGKTSLLDRIRHSNVAATETGGITQVLRAWRVETGGKAITFLDTPGHEAFTQMRARGANVTDIAIIVVAADDGVMPQTEEAINHAKAAGVSLVVAINKVDLPNANVLRTRQQLYALAVLPDNMGGDTPFVETSAATGKGMDELLDQLAVVAELKELRANPKRPASGTCLEASLSEGEGVRATLLVQDGTLHKGDVVLCGAAYGRVRQLYDDLGRLIQEAGPSVPVRVTGLDEVPHADDPFQVVPDLATARAIALERKHRQHQAARVKREPLRLEKLTEAKVVELKVILKADFRGSVEAIRKELEKLHRAEVHVRLLHAGIGAITEGDVQLALTSPQDTLIVGFNVVPDDRALAQAGGQGVPIRQYDVIYHLIDDVRAALEGKLRPREQVVHRGCAVVRQTFKVSRVGTIAGCFVTQGVIERSAKVRVIREGMIIYAPADRTASLESLRRFKDDVREVREGFECGLKIGNYDDVKVGDVIEAYRVEQVQRTLQP
jgi:translation initiation factor IF-2